MADFVAYYRVSTDRQGVSGLGLDAQRASVECFLAPGQALAAAFTEIESGRRDRNRPQLHALAECRKRRLPCSLPGLTGSRAASPSSPT